MSKLVKARPKRVEDLPEWAKCCAELLTKMEKIGVTHLDMETIFSSAKNECPFCRTIYPAVRYVMRRESGAYVPLEIFDLDEGPAEVTA